MKLTFSVEFDDKLSHGLSIEIERDVAPSMVARGVKSLVRSLVWTLQLAGYLDDASIADVLHLGCKSHPAPRANLEEARERAGLSNQKPLIVTERKVA